MPWGRSILAIVTTLVVVGGMASLYVMGAGIWRPDFSNVPGVNPQDMAALAAPYDDVSQGRDAELAASLVESNAGTQAEIDRIQTLLPPGAATSSRLTTFNVATGTDGNRLWGVREYEYPGHVVRAETTLYRATASEPWKVSGFNVNVLSREELAERTFDIMTEPRGVQAVIAAAVVFPLFILITFWTALFRQGLKVRWIWLIAIVLGIGTIYADTASDALSFLPISVQLFGAGATWSGSAFDGWVFSASTPLGAAAFWLFAPRAAKSV
ncbi:MAG: hypothetical protein NT015_13220 [Alphaproteobacteria bacterium]|nr:hypothetical protein [Alphaproteobacteria bacterium]